MKCTHDTKTTCDQCCRASFVDGLAVGLILGAILLFAVGTSAAQPVGTRQLAVVKHHPDWDVDGVRWSEKNGYKFVAVYLPKSDTPKTIIVDRGFCQCTSRPYWDSVYRRGEWVDIPIENDFTGDVLISIYIVNSGQFPGPADAVIQNLRLSELPQIEYVKMPFPQRRRALD